MSEFFNGSMQALEKSSVFFYIPATNISYCIIWQTFSAILCNFFYISANSFHSVCIAFMTEWNKWAHFYINGYGHVCNLFTYSDICLFTFVWNELIQDWFRYRALFKWFGCDRMIVARIYYLVTLPVPQLLFWNGLLFELWTAK